MCVLAQHNPDVFKSVDMWEESLQKAGWNTYLPISQDLPDFICALHESPWQKEQMIKHGWAIILIDSTHNYVNNLCLSDGRKVSLYTIIICDPTSGKGLPVCWAFNARASA
jgi:hypothetical protein